jgi:DNA polymerase-3 subunit delta
MTESKPNILILHGDDEIAMQRFISQQILSLGDSSMADVNTSRLDGKTCSEDDIYNTVMATPFFSTRRLTILTNPLHKLESKKAGDESASGVETGKTKEARMRFFELLENLPETTLLVLVIEDHQKWRAGGFQWESLTDRHFLTKWAATQKERVAIHGFALPSSREMPTWIQKKAKELGGQISLPGAVELAEYVGSDTRLAVLELDKLITYANGREVSSDDVMSLSTSVMSGRIWDLTDAIGERGVRKGLQMLPRFLGTLALSEEIYPMIIWQFRQLLLGCEVVSHGGGLADLMQDLKIAEFQAKKLLPQVQRFKLTQLKRAYRKLMEIEEESKGAAEKAGGGDLSVLIDQLIVDLAG